MNAHFIEGDVLQGLATLPDQSVQTCITSPPYHGLRDYGTAKWEGGDAMCAHKPAVKPRLSLARNGLTGGLHYLSAQEPNYKATCRKCGALQIDNQIGLEETPDAYVAKLVEVFREVRRVLKNDGTAFLNLGDSYAGGRTGRADADRPNGELQAAGKRGGKSHKLIAATLGNTGRPVPDGLKPKDLIGIPWRVAFALQADGWYLRQDIIWAKPNPMPESVRDRCTKAHEYVFLLSKSPRYLYQAEAIKEPAITARGEYRNRRSVWTVTPKPFKEAHFAVMPEALAEPCVLAGSRPGDLVLDPFAGSGTVAVVANRHGRAFVGCELNPAYIEIAERRLGLIAAAA